jgi:hypothetical protein
LPVEAEVVAFVAAAVVVAAAAVVVAMLVVAAVVVVADVDFFEPPQPAARIAGTTRRTEASLNPIGDAPLDAG